MNPFLLGAAIRAVHRRRDPRAGRHGRKPLWWLVGWLLQDSVRRVLARRAVALTAAVVLMALGIAVALSDLTPGPVLPHPDRWVAAGLVVGVATAASWLLPRRWRAPLWAATAAVVALVEVGLHHATPGPVLRAPVRWLVAGLPLVAVVVLQVLHRDGDRRARSRNGR